MATPACICCAHPAGPTSQPSAAFVLLFGHEPPAAVLRRVSERARAALIPGVAVYCTHCRCSRPAASHACLQDALIEHELMHRRWTPHWNRHFQNQKH